MYKMYLDIRNLVIKLHTIEGKQIRILLSSSVRTRLYTCLLVTRTFSFSGDITLLYRIVGPRVPVFFFWHTSLAPIMIPEAKLVANPLEAKEGGKKRRKDDTFSTRIVRDICSRTYN